MSESEINSWDLWFPPSTVGKGSCFCAQQQLHLCGEVGLSPSSALPAPEKEGCRAPALQPGALRGLHSHVRLGGTWPLRRRSFAKFKIG